MLVPSTPDLPRVAALLERFDVACVLVGGMSAWVYGATQLTSDIDTVARWTRANLGNLSHALNAVDAQIRIKVAPDGDESKDTYVRPPGGFEYDTLRHLSSFRVRTQDGDMLDFLDSIPLEAGPGGRRAGYDELVEHALEATIGDTAIRVVSLAELLASKRAVGRTHDLTVVAELEAKATANHLPAPSPEPG